MKKVKAKKKTDSLVIKDNWAQSVRCLSNSYDTLQKMEASLLLELLVHFSDSQQEIYLQPLVILKKLSQESLRWKLYTTLKIQNYEKEI